MKILHTADWHLGKIVNGFSMLDDQRYTLMKMCEQIENLELDAFILAGDLYDRANPSQASIALANELIEKIVLDLSIPLVMIAGNHDSPQLLSYGQKLMSKKQLYTEGKLKNTCQCVSIAETDFWLLPFAEPAQGRFIYGQDDIKNYEDLACYQVSQIEKLMNPARVNILLYHAYVVPCSSHSLIETDSERPLAIGGSEYIPVEYFSAFDYVALGHLHQAQKVKTQRVRYSGSPLKYSKSESQHRKSYTVIDIDKNFFEWTTYPFEFQRDMVVKTGYFHDLLQESSKDYVFVELLDEHYQLSSFDRLHQSYPYLMGISYLNRLQPEDHRQIFSRSNLKQKDLAHLFMDFYEHVHQTTMAEKQKQIVKRTYEDLLEEVD